MMELKNVFYKKLTVEAAVNGWIVKENGKPTEVFVRWDAFVRKLEMELTSKGLEV